MARGRYLLNAEKISAMALAMGLSEAQLCRIAKVEEHILTHARKGKRCYPSTVKKIADALGCEVFDIIKEKEKWQYLQ